MDAFKQVVKLLAFASLLFTAAEVYLTLNRLWIRKHERSVAESISMMAKLIGIVPLAIFAVDNMFIGQWRGFIDNALWIVAAVVQIAIAAGLWVAMPRRTSTLQLFARALRTESSELGRLASEILRPPGARKVLDLMSRLAFLDHHLDPRERQLLRAFGKAWGEEVKERASIAHGVTAASSRFDRLQETLAEYLATSPPSAHLAPVADVLTLLAHADGTVAPEEERALADLHAMVAARHGESAGPLYYAAVVPTSAEDRAALAREQHALAPAALHAFVAGPFHSRRFADVVVAQYRDKFTAAVVDPAQVTAAHSPNGLASAE